MVKRNKYGRGLPKTFALVGDEVWVLTTYILNGREEARQCLKEAFETEWVWFEDEIGTDKDPIHGPNPVAGPRANGRQ